jgi:beta-lactamase regulating signal transducer with metallopeptidase domain
MSFNSFSLNSVALSLDALARLSAERVFNCLAQGIVIALFAWILLRIAGRRNSSTRFAVWFSALLGVAALPWIVPLASSGSAPGAGGAGSLITMPGSWALIMFLVWAVIASAALSRVALGLWQLRKLRRSCIAIDPATLDPALQRTLQEFGSPRSMQLCLSDRLRVPTAIGFLNPAVVFPAWAMEELSTAELNSILIHELAHLRRWDDWTNLAQKVLRAVLFFHPAVWWIESRLSLEREMACDDVVLSRTANPRAYAECLVAVAEKSFMRRGLALAQAAVNRMRHTSLRVSQILDANRSGATLVWKPALYLVAAFSVVCIATLSRAPELVAFQDKMPEVAASAAGQSRLAVDSSRFTRAAVPLAIAPPAMVPAKLARFAIQPANTMATRPGRARRDLSSSVRTDVELAQPYLNQSQPDQSALVQAKATMPVEEAAAPRAVFVVMQREQFGEAGSMQWTICVWRVMVWDSARPPVQKGIPAKSI